MAGRLLRSTSPSGRESARYTSKRVSHRHYAEPIGITSSFSLSAHRVHRGPGQSTQRCLRPDAKGVGRLPGGRERPFGLPPKNLSSTSPAASNLKIIPRLSFEPLGSRRDPPPGPGPYSTARPLQLLRRKQARLIRQSWAHPPLHPAPGNIIKYPSATVPVQGALPIG
jgi:hypothetical protein